jgi:hypothetical protein
MEVTAAEASATKAPSGPPAPFKTAAATTGAATAATAPGLSINRRKWNFNHQKRYG